MAGASRRCSTIRNPYPTQELALPPTNRFNVGFNFDGAALLGSASVNYSDKAFWSDVLTSPYHGFTDAYTMVNGSFGVKWANGKVDDAREGDEPAEPGHPAARLRRHPEADRVVRGADQIV